MLSKPTVLFFILTTVALPTVAQTSQFLGQSIYQEISSLSLKENPVAPDTSPAVPPASSAVVSASEASFTIHRQETVLLLYLKNDRNRIRLQITNAVGQTTKPVFQQNMAGGFYELPIFRESAPPGVYTINLTVNERVLTFQATR